MPCEQSQVAKSCGQAASFCHPWMSWHSLRQLTACPEKMICASLRRLARLLFYGSYMKVLELMNPKVITIGLKTPLREVLQLILRYHLNSIVVVDGEERLAGIITHSDLSRKLLPTQKELMEHEEYLTNPRTMEDRFRDFV